MSRRIEVELTSQRDDGTWTWRAAGAKQPKGVLDGSLLYDGVAVGDVVRADADFEIDGIFVTAVMPPKGRSGKPEAERIELLGSGGTFEGVTTQLAKGRRDGGERGGRGRGRGRGDRRGPREDGDRRGRGERGDRNQGGRRDRGEGGRDRGDRRPRRDRDDAPARPKAKKLRPGRVHRKALIDGLPEEQRVVAETVSRGGIAAVRKEIETQNARAASEGAPEVKADALIALAEGLLPQVKAAEWRDRADAALAGVDEVDIRDLRTVLVAAEDAARDDEARAVAEQLREGLNARVERAQTEWHDELRSTLGEGRVVRALRLSSRPPKAGSPLPPDIAEQLTGQANEALTDEVTQQRLGIVLEAVAYSPVRPYIVLATIPETPNEELLESVKKVAARIPEIATRFGIDPTARRRGGRNRGRGRGKGGAPADARPQKDATPQDDATPEEAGAPAAEEALADAPAADAPEAADAPAADAPEAADAPAADAPEAADAPAADAPAADAPAADAPAADAPEPADAPAADAPEAAEPPAADASAADAGEAPADTPEESDASDEDAADAASDEPDASEAPAASDASEDDEQS